MAEKKTIAVITDPENKNEFLLLAKEAGYTVEDELRVRNVTSNVLSKHKRGELRQLVQMHDADTVMLDLPLKPRQSYTIASSVKARPLDRVEVILEIFQRHAPNREANLQVKAAQLSYELTRAKEKVRLAKKEEHPGFYGLGAYKADVYYEEIQKRRTKIQEKLKKIRARRELHRNWRSKHEIKTVSITGYTCSGKTTLFNALTGLLQRVGEEPFTTLSTKFATVQMGPWNLYLVDTIGFILDLPPFLVDAFYSTLEELVFSEVVLLVLDSSEPIARVLEKFKSSYNHLIELEVFDKPIIVVLNKIDVASGNAVEELVKYFHGVTPYVVSISALEETNLEELAEVIAEVAGDSVKVECFVPYAAGKSFYSVVGDLKSGGLVEDMDYSGEGVRIEATVPSSLGEKLRKDLHRIGGRIKVG